MPTLDITGQKYGLLTAMEPAGFEEATANHRRRALWLCRCECGNETTVRKENLRSGNTTSCGCWKKQNYKLINLKHGHNKKDHRSPIYRVWSTMLERCRNPKNQSFKDYGARGIQVCERWHKFANFLADMGERPSDGHSIDRIDNDGNYEPSNCKWSTRIEQRHNRRDTISVKPFTSDGAEAQANAA